MPKRIDPYARGQVVYAAFRELVREGGIEAVSLRAVAARASLAVSSLRHGYRDREFLLRCMVHDSTAWFFRATLGFRLSDDPVRDVIDLLSTQVPEHDDGVGDALTWLAFVARARTTDDDTRRAIAEVRSVWLELCTDCTRLLGVPEDERPLEGQRLALVVESLITAVCDPGMPVDRDGALAMLERHVRSLHESAHRGAS